MKTMNIPFSPPDITEKEIEAVTEVMRSGWLTTGPKTKQFEEELAQYCQTNKVVTLNSATACMEMTLRLLGIGPGDEVITTAYTYTASASVIAHVGAKIVLVDTQKDSFSMDYDALEKAITPKTKVIIPVDLGGKMCDYDRIFAILEHKRELFQPTKGTLQEAFNRVIVLADAAHSLGAKYKGKVSGSVADFTSFSFHAVKNLTTAEGGAVTWSVPFENNEEIYKQFLLYALHGQTKDALSKNKLGAWEYDIVAPLYKCNMTDINAAIGLSQLSRYDKILSRRKEIIESYDKAFKNLKTHSLEHYTEENCSSGHLYLLRVDNYSVSDRNELIYKLAQRGIATNVHYKPLPMLTAYKNMGFDIEDYPNAYNQYQNEITLPVYSTLGEAELYYIIDNVIDLLS